MAALAVAAATGGPRAEQQQLEDLFRLDFRSRGPVGLQHIGRLGVAEDALCACGRVGAHAASEACACRPRDVSHILATGTIGTAAGCAVRVAEPGDSSLSLAPQHALARWHDEEGMYTVQDLSMGVQGLAATGEGPQLTRAAAGPCAPSAMSTRGSRRSAAVNPDVHSHVSATSSVAESERSPHRRGARAAKGDSWNSPSRPWHRAPSGRSAARDAPTRWALSDLDEPSPTTFLTALMQRARDSPEVKDMQTVGTFLLLDCERVCRERAPLALGDVFMLGEDTLVEVIEAMPSHDSLQRQHCLPPAADGLSSNLTASVLAPPSAPVPSPSASRRQHSVCRLPRSTLRVAPVGESAVCELVEFPQHGAAPSAQLGSEFVINRNHTRPLAAIVGGGSRTGRASALEDAAAAPPESSPCASPGLPGAAEDSAAPVLHPAPTHRPRWRTSAAPDGAGARDAVPSVPSVDSRIGSGSLSVSERSVASSRHHDTAAPAQRARARHAAIAEKEGVVADSDRAFFAHDGRALLPPSLQQQRRSTRRGGLKHARPTASPPQPSDAASVAPPPLASPPPHVPRLRLRSTSGDREPTARVPSSMSGSLADGKLAVSTHVPAPATASSLATCARVALDVEALPGLPLLYASTPSLQPERAVRFVRHPIRIADKQQAAARKAQPLKRNPLASSMVSSVTLRVVPRLSLLLEQCRSRPARRVAPVASARKGPSSAFTELLSEQEHSGDGSDAALAELEDVHSFVIRLRSDATLGAGVSNAVRVAAPGLCPVHAKIEFRHGVCWLRDLSVNSPCSTRLLLWRPTFVQPGDVLVLGREEFALAPMGECTDCVEQWGAMALRITPLRESRRKRAHAPWSGRLPSRYALIDRRTATIGRSKKCDVRVADFSLGREHAVVTFDDGRYHIGPDPKRRGAGTYLLLGRGQPLDPWVATSWHFASKGPYQLHAGDSFRLGCSLFTVEELHVETQRELQRRRRLTLRRQEQLWRGVPLFSHLDATVQQEVASQLRPVKFRNGDVILRQGQHAHAFYIIHEGQVRVTCRQLVQLSGTGEAHGDVTEATAALAAAGGVTDAHPAPGSLVEEELELAVLQPGQYFGEMALLADRPHEASVSAIGNVTCLVLDRQAFQLLMGPLQEALSFVIKKREAAGALSVLNSLPLLSHLPLQHKQRMAELMETRRFAQGETVLRRGQAADEVPFLIVISGELVAFRPQEKSASGSPIACHCPPHCPNAVSGSGASGDHSGGGGVAVAGGSSDDIVAGSPVVHPGVVHASSGSAIRVAFPGRTYCIEECPCKCGGSVLDDGSAYVTRFRVGEFVGDEPLLSGQRQAADVVADGVVECLALSPAAFRECMAPVMECVEQQLRAARASRPHRRPGTAGAARPQLRRGSFIRAVSAADDMEEGHFGGAAARREDKDEDEEEAAGLLLKEFPKVYADSEGGEAGLRAGAEAGAAEEGEQEEDNDRAGGLALRCADVLEAGGELVGSLVHLPRMPPLACSLEAAVEAAEAVEAAAVSHEIAAVQPAAEAASADVGVPAAPARDTVSPRLLRGLFGAEVLPPLATACAPAGCVGAPPAADTVKARPPSSVCSPLGRRSVLLVGESAKSYCSADVVRSIMAEQKQHMPHFIQLRAMSGPRQREVFVLDSDVVTFGRAGASITINDAGLSELHALLEYRDGSYWLTDAQSATGTFLQLGAGLEFTLDVGDVVQVGNTELAVLAQVQARRRREAAPARRASVEAPPRSEAAPKQPPRKPNASCTVS